MPFGHAKYKRVGNNKRKSTHPTNRRINRLNRGRDHYITWTNFSYDNSIRKISADYNHTYNIAPSFLSIGICTIEPNVFCFETWNNIPPAEVYCDNPGSFPQTWYAYVPTGVPPLGPDSYDGTFKFPFTAQTLDPYEDYTTTYSPEYEVSGGVGCVVGDLNGDGLINILDVVMLINCVLNGGVCAGGSQVDCAADFTGDGNINILDVVSLINCILSEDGCDPPRNNRERDLLLRLQKAKNIDEMYGITVADGRRNRI